MKARGLIILLLCFSGLGHVACGQHYYSDSDIFRGVYLPVSYQLDYQDIDGTAYENDQLIKGLVVFRAGDSIETYLRYNVYEDAVEFLEENELQAIANAHRIDHILIGTRKLIYTPYLLDGTITKGFLYECTSGKVRLFRKPVIELEDPEDGATGYHKGTPRSFSLKPTVWLMGKEKGPITNVVMNKSQLRELFGEEYDQVDDYRKENKLKLKQDNDLIALFEYFNSL